jgi:hypothetical protein
VAEHQGEEPDRPGDPGLVRERRAELGEVDLRLAAGRGLSNRRSNVVRRGGRAARRKSVTTL